MGIFKSIMILSAGIFLNVVAHCENFRLYNQFINQAELSITDSNFSKALDLYDSAGLFREKPFAQDLYNAALCAAKIGNKNKAIAYCERLAIKGVGDRFFSQNEFLKPLRTSPKWAGILSKAKSGKASILKKNGRLVKTIDSLVAADQAMNKRWRNSGMNNDTASLMYRVNDTIARALINIIQKQGFPTEDETGVHIADNGDIELGRPFDVIIIHNYEAWGVGDSLFNGVLIQALSDEKVKPEYYARMRDFAGGRSPETYFGTAHMFVQYKCQVFRNKYTDTVKLAETRKRIGLCSLDDYIKKLMFNIMYRHTEFQLNAYCSRYMNFKDPESEKSFLDSNVLVVDSIPNCKN